MTKKSERAGRVDYDNLFKTAMKDYFWEGLQIFLPELYEAADRSVPVKFLDQELQKVTLKLGGGRRRIDMLAEIQLEGGKKELVLCHIEIQGKGGRDLALRMMRYRSAIFLQYGREPVGIAVITGSRPRREKRFYSSELFGVETFYKYKNVVILDIPDEVLLAGNNRVGFVLYAAKCAAKSGKDEGKKFHYLRLISDLWNAAGWSPHDKRVLLEMVNYLLNLQDQDYVEQIVKYQENLTMKKEDREMFVSMFERVYTARGREEGIQQGLRQGKQEIAKNLLADGMALEVVARNTGLPMDDIRALAN